MISVGVVEVTDVSTSTASAYGAEWTVNFSDNIGNLDLLVLSCNNLVGTSVDVQITPVTTGSEATFTSGTVGIYQRPLGDATVAQTNSVQTITVNSSSIDLNGYFYVLNAGEVSGQIDVYTTASEMETILEDMLTLTDVTVTMTDLSFSTTGNVQRYGRTWSITFSEPHAPSLLVSVGSDYDIVATGGTILGTATMVNVERVVTESIPLNYIVTGLTAGVQYVSRVSAFNGYFWSDAVVSSIAVVPKLMAPVIPTGVSMKRLSDTQIQVWWTAPEQTGGSAVTGYSVQYDIGTTFGTTAQSQFVTGATSYVITGLTASNSYYVRISAYNALGYSDMVNAENTVDWMDVQSISIDASGSDVSDATGSAFQVGYNDGYRTEYTGDLTLPSAAELQTALQGLEAVRSVIVTRVDESTNSNYDLTGVNTNEIRVTYRITFVVSSFAAAKQQLTRTSSDSTLLGLVTISSDRTGVSRPSFVTLMTVTAPSAPTGVILTVVSNTEVGVRWIASDFTGGSAITKYAVEWDNNMYFVNFGDALYTMVREPTGFVESTSDYTKSLV